MAQRQPLLLALDTTGRLSGWACWTPCPAATEGILMMLQRRCCCRCRGGGGGRVVVSRRAPEHAGGSQRKRPAEDAPVKVAGARLLLLLRRRQIELGVSVRGSSVRYSSGLWTLAKGSASATYVVRTVRTVRVIVVLCLLPGGAELNASTAATVDGSLPPQLRLSSRSSSPSQAALHKQDFSSAAHQGYASFREKTEQERDQSSGGSHSHCDWSSLS